MVDDWNDEEIGSVADDTTTPDPPDWVSVHASQTRVQVLWESPADGDSGGEDPTPEWDAEYVGEDWDEVEVQGPGDIDADLTPTEITADDTEEVLGFDVETDEEIAYFQVQVATDSDFQNIIRHDRMVKGHTRTWRYSKPSTTTFYARVRSVDRLGNKSEWVTSSDSNKFPYQPHKPNVTMIKQANGNYQANVNYINDATLSPDLDETISRFQFAMRELEFTRLDGGISASDATLVVQDYVASEVPMNPGTDTPNFTVYVGAEQMTVTAISGGFNKTWHITRGVNGTTAVAHSNSAKVYYFGQGTSSTIQHVLLDDDKVRTTVVFRGLDPGSRWKFRVRVVDAQNRKSFWSAWTPVLKAAKGVFYDNGDDLGGTGETGDPDEDVEPPEVDPPAPTEDPDGDEDPIETTWPHERIIRFEMDVSDAFESTAVTGYDAIVTSARATVTTAPTSDATVDVNLNGVSFLTLTIPADDPKSQSDLTWVTPPLRIGSQVGQAVANTDELTVTETDIQDATGTLTVYLMVYLA